MQGAIKGEGQNIWRSYQNGDFLNFVYAPTFENLNEGPAYTYIQNIKGETR